MISTFEALLVALLALLPGAGYTWAFEQQAGRWGANFRDRAWRFVGVSAAFGALGLPVLYQVYRELIVSGRLAEGDSLPWWVWILSPIYFAVPWLAGLGVGYGARKRQRWVSLFTGPGPAPRAWDHLFTSPDLNGWILLQLKDDT